MRNQEQQQTEKMTYDRVKNVHNILNTLCLINTELLTRKLFRKKMRNRWNDVFNELANFTIKKRQINFIDCCSDYKSGVLVVARGQDPN